jgi:exopolysaccharide biosynthesis polyprenyl glycosylphosphotransferase
VTSMTQLAAPPAPGVLVDTKKRALYIPARGEGLATPVPGLVPIGDPVRSGAPSTTRSTRPIPWLTIAGDAVAAAAGTGIAVLLGVPVGVTAAVLLPVLWVCLLAATRAFESREVGVTLAESSRRVLRSGAALALTVVGVAAVAEIAAGPGQLLFVSGAFATASLTHRVSRTAWHTFVDMPTDRRTKVVVAGRHPRDVARVMAELRRTPQHTLDVAAVCLERAPKRTTFDVPMAVGLDHLADTAAVAGAQTVIVLPCQHLGDTELRRIGWQLERAGVDLFVGTPLLDVAASRTTLAHAGGLRMLRVRPSRRQGLVQLVKNLLERPLAALMLLVLAPLLIGICLTIRHDSPGRAIFSQTRVGRDGRNFTMYKFRTMSDGADAIVEELSDHNESDGLLFKMRQDPRITGIGAVLRKFSLDEVPQLMNVVLGHMSLVGPRPALPVEALQYCRDARRRLDVKPGLTGLWQVSGRSDLSWDETVRLDACYVDNWSPALDASILLRTVQAVLTHRGAY